LQVRYKHDELLSMPRVVAITGASRGIGLAIAQRFAARGDDLALNYFVCPEALEPVIAQARSHGGDGIAIQADISEPQQARAFIAAAEQRFGHLDVLVNNAGILISVPTAQCSWEQWQRTLAVNLSGTFLCLSAALPGMIRRRSGRIINISSELGLIGYPTYAAYSASKGGVIALTKAVAKEVAPFGILVNSVAPGPVETDMLIKDSTEYNDAARLQLPLQRFGRPEEIAAMVEALAGEAGSFMVGQIVSPNGGAAI
jgi:NAD(P)-dependent dehydrogenase (short-subunit alcohol dehydrogenase family)